MTTTSTTPYPTRFRPKHSEALDRLIDRLDSVGIITTGTATSIALRQLGVILRDCGFAFVDEELVRELWADRDVYRRVKEVPAELPVDPLTGAEARLMVDFGNETLTNIVLSQNPYSARHRS